MSRSVAFVWVICLLSFGSSLAQELDLEQRLELSKRSLEANYTSYQRNDVLMISYILNQAYGAEIELPDLESTLERRPELKESAFSIAGHYFANKDSLAQKNEEIVAWMGPDYHKAIDKMTAWSMFCHQYPLPKDYSDHLRSAAESGGYALTHAVFQYKNALFGTCLDPDEELETLFKEALKDLHLSPDLDPSIGWDLKLEAYIMEIYLFGETDDRKEALNLIQAAMDTEGHWFPGPEAHSPNEHTHILGLWLCLLLLDLQ